VKTENPNEFANTLQVTQEQPESILYVLFIASVAAIGGFLFGFDSGVINGTVTALGNAFNSSDVSTGFNVASVLLGCALGALAAGPLSDHYGRKAIMIITAVIFAISAFGSGISDSSVEFIFYRLFGGLGIGAASVLAPAYIAEVAPAAIRGRLATLQQLAIVLGLFVAF
jgi:SP family sugar:H+ symporter-like MFS transporter